jgi:DNA (cytosine-5)-methyltransferase 1
VSVCCPLKVGSFCSGAGGLELGVERALGARTVWQSEIDPHGSTVLAARWPGVPNLGDLRGVDWTAVEPVDLVCFGFPCQDISSAGRRAGLEGEKSALWFDCAHAIRVLRPRYVLVENVSALLVRGFDVVLAELAEMGYVGRWGCLRSSDVGAPHRRERIFLAAAHTNRGRTGRDLGAVPRQATEDRRTGADVRPAPDGGATPAHSDLAGREGSGSPVQSRGSQSADGSSANPEASRYPNQQDSSDPGRFPVGAVLGTGPGDRGGDLAPGVRELGRPADVVAWGPYESAVRRWEAIHGPAPRPRDDRGRLNPELPEWMMGFPSGWVTGLNIPRTAQLRLMGNACQPQVSEMATRTLLVPLLVEAAAA